MRIMDQEARVDHSAFLAEELRNFEEILKFLSPSAGEIPSLAGVDIAGFSRPLRGTLGGDHTIYIDFKKRYDLDGRIARARAARMTAVAEQLEAGKRRAGILLADVAGHRITDALVAAMLHQAFLLGSYYELEMFGQITTNLFEQIKTRFYESTNIKKLIAMIYGEIAEDGRFRYVSAGHPPPIVFSHEFRRLMPLGEDRTVSESLVGLHPAGSGVPSAGRIATAPRESHVVNEIELLMPGDILLLATDGFTDHAGGHFVEYELQGCLDGARDLPAAGVCDALEKAVLGYAEPEDDLTFVVIKRA
jgi:serine phosphatase RsbU (regulator of sigma subunit)